VILLHKVAFVKILIKALKNKTFLRVLKIESQPESFSQMYILLLNDARYIRLNQ